ncbi:hypothetical protein HRI_004694000 [Hibiscus trionum]|uniref:Uncharacterized protein n=1 Tax=Hibiscus trionum TaxID=183268 RepID=A0A9W7J8W3_HIBTR|nr:hypothetical protein HRI_004694000 [Hibiscus trionum]
MIPHSILFNHTDPSLLNDPCLHRFVEVGNKLADVAGEVICSYFKKKFEILDKEYLSPVTIADQAVEESMVPFFYDLPICLEHYRLFLENVNWGCIECFFCDLVSCANHLNELWNS